MECPLVSVFYKAILMLLRGFEADILCYILSYATFFVQLSKTCWTGATCTLCSVSWLTGLFCYVHDVGGVKFANKSQYYMCPVSTASVESVSKRSFLLLQDLNAADQRTAESVSSERCAGRCATLWICRQDGASHCLLYELFTFQSPALQVYSTCMKEIRCDYFVECRMKRAVWVYHEVVFIKSLYSITAVLHFYLLSLVEVRRQFVSDGATLQLNFSLFVMFSVVSRSLCRPVCCCLNTCLLLPYFVVFWLFIFQLFPVSSL